MNSANHHTAPSAQRGNIFTILFAAVAVVGIITASTMNLISGPIRTAAKVNAINMANANMQAAGRIIIIDAANQANSGDTDSDGTIEPRAFTTVASGGITGGGSIPATVGAAGTDPWGKQYGYCVWNNGTSNGALTNILAGAVVTGSPIPTVIAIVSAGPNKVFETSCVAYASGATTGDAVTTGVVRVSGSDDIVMKYSYAEALAASSGLWAIKAGAPTTATINKNLEVTDPNNSNAVTASINRSTGIGDFLGITTDLIAAKSTSGIQFNTSGGTNAMRIDSSGNIGIGTTTPTSLLHITNAVIANDSKSQINLSPRTSGSQVGIDLLRNNGTLRGFVGYRGSSSTAPNADGIYLMSGSIDSYPLIFAPGATERMRIDSLGNVGIGTTTSTIPLAVSSSSRNIGTWNFNGNFVSIVPGTLNDTSGSTTNRTMMYIAGPTLTAGSAQALGLATTLFINGGPTAGTNVTITKPVALLANGDTQFDGKMIVGSGTGSVGNSTLDLYAPTTVTSWSTNDGPIFRTIAGTITDNFSAASSVIATRHANSFGIPTFASTNPITVTNASNLFIRGAPVAGTNTTITNSHSLYVSAGNSYFGGNMSIGVTTVGYPLNVYSFSATEGQIATHSNSSNNTSGVDFMHGAGATIRRGFVGYRGSSSSAPNGTNGIYLWAGSANPLMIGSGDTERIRILSSGEVGIGTTTPSTALVVNGTITATNLALTSDKRKKTSIVHIEDGLDVINKLDPVSYYWASNSAEGKTDNTQQFGLIAQDVEKIIPEIVNTDKDGFKSINYVQIIAHIVDAIQDLFEKITGIFERLEALEKRIDALETENQALKQAINSEKS